MMILGILVFAGMCSAPKKWGFSCFSKKSVDAVAPASHPRFAAGGGGGEAWHENPMHPKRPLTADEIRAHAAKARSDMEEGKEAVDATMAKHEAFGAALARPIGDSRRPVALRVKPGVSPARRELDAAAKAAGDRRKKLEGKIAAKQKAADEAMVKFKAAMERNTAASKKAAERHRETAIMALKSKKEHQAALDTLNAQRFNLARQSIVLRGREEAALEAELEEAFK